MVVDNTGTTVAGPSVIRNNFATDVPLSICNDQGTRVCYINNSGAANVNNLVVNSTLSGTGTRLIVLFAVAAFRHHSFG